MTFKNYLKHKKKPMSLEDVIMRLQIESRDRNAEKLITKEHYVNMAELKEKVNSPAKPSKTVAPLRASGSNFKKTTTKENVEK